MLIGVGMKIKRSYNGFTPQLGKLQNNLLSTSGAKKKRYGEITANSVRNWDYLYFLI